MSLSSLSEQLAKLNQEKQNNNNGLGLSIKGSKRHDEASGRGINYSTQYNQTTTSTSNNKSEKYKPSFFENTSTSSASDVSIFELLQKCRSSLLKLETLHDGFHVFLLESGSGIAGIKSYERERGLLSPNENIELDKDICRLLVLLSLVIQKDPMNSLHVLEYLLRRYDIHTREKTADALLVIFSMHYSKPIYFRIMEFIDLATLVDGSTWIFLRPYAVKGSDPPNSTIFSKRCSVDGSMLKKHLTFMRDVAVLGDASDNDRTTITTSIESILSFHGGIIHEALKIQYQSKGVIQEQTLRLVLPLVIDFMSSSCDMLCKCAFVLIIQLLQYTNHALNEKVLHLLRNTTIEAAVAHESLLPEAMMVFLALTTSQQLDTSSPSLYPVIRFQASTYALTCKHYKVLVPCLGYLWQEQSVNVLSIIMAILSSAMKQLTDNKGTTRKDASLQLISYITDHQTLASLWETNYPPTHTSSTNNTAMHTLLSTIDEVDHNFSTACAYTLLVTYTTKKNKPRKIKSVSNFTHNFQACFALLQEKSPTGVNTAIIQFILEYIMNQKQTEQDRNMYEATLTNLLPQTKKLLVQQHKLTQSSSNNNAILIQQISNLLSPTILMKHTNPFVRMENIQKFAKDPSDMSVEKKLMLLDIFVNDVDAKVAIEAYESLFLDLDKDKDSVTGKITVEIALTSMKRWGLCSSNSMNNDNISTEQMKACTYSIQLSQIAIQQHLVNEDNKMTTNPSVLSLIQAIGAHTYNSNHTHKINTAAKNIMLEIFKMDNNTTFPSVSLSHPTCIDILQKCIQQLNDASTNHTQMTKQDMFCMYHLMSFLKSSFNIHSSAGEELIKTHLHPIQPLITTSIMSVVSYMDNCSGNSKESSNNYLTKDDYTLFLNVWKHICYPPASIQQENNNKLPNLSYNDVVPLMMKLTSYENLYSQFGEKAFSIVCDAISSTPSSKDSTFDKMAIMLEICNNDIKVQAKTRILELIQSDLPQVITSSDETGGKECNDSSLSCTMLSCFALVTHTDEHVRRIAIQILFTICKNNEHQKKDLLWNRLYLVMKASSSSSSSNLSVQKFLTTTQYLISYNGGTQMLADILDSISDDSKDKKGTLVLRKLLLQRCLAYATNTNTANGTNTTVATIFGRQRNGCYSSIYILLSAMQTSSSFSQEECWEYFGTNIYWNYCSKQPSSEEELLVFDAADQSPLGSMFECVVRMLLDHDHSNKHNFNTRTKTVNYNQDMAKAIQHCLFIKASSSVAQPTSSSMITSPFVSCFFSNIVDVIFTNVSWLENIFIHYGVEHKQTIAMSLLLICSSDTNDDMDLVRTRQAWMNLPLEINDYTLFIDVWKKSHDKLLFTSSIGTISLQDSDNNITSSSSSSLVSFTFILDSIRSRMNSASSAVKDTASSSSDLWALICKLFYQLHLMCCVDTTNTQPDKDTEYVILFTLQTLLDIYGIIQTNQKLAKFMTSKFSTKKKNDSTKLQSFVDLLVGIIGGLEVHDDKMEESDKEEDQSSTKYKLLQSDKGKVTAISLLTNLCSQSPEIVLNSLITSMLGIISFSFSSSKDDDDKMEIMNLSLLKDTFMIIIPSFCKFTGIDKTDGLPSLSDLITAFVWHCHTNNFPMDANLTLYSWFIQALLSGERSLILNNEEKEGIDNIGVSIASFISVLTALESRKVLTNTHMDTATTMIEDGEEEKSNTFVSFVFELLQQTINIEDPSVLIVVYHQLLTHTENVLGLVLEDTSSSDAAMLKNNKDKSDIGNKFAIDTNDIILFASSSEEENKDTTLMWITTNLLHIVKQGLLLKSSILDENMLCNITTPSSSSLDSSNIFVSMSRQFIRIRIASSITTKENKKAVVENHAIKNNFFNAIEVTTKECTDFLNFSLPFSHFITCITSIIKNDTTTTITTTDDNNNDISMKKYALQILSEKAADVEAGSPEALTLLDIVHTDLSLLIDVDTFLSSKNDVTKQRQLVVFQQAVFIAIERIVYFAFRPGVYSREVEMKLGEKTLLPLLQNIVSMVQKLVVNMRTSSEEFLTKKEETVQVENTLTSQLLSSALLSTTTFIYAMKMKCLPILPNLIPSLTSCLTVINKCQKKYSDHNHNESLSKDPVESTSFLTNLNLMQHSILRVLSSSVETLPQFMKGYLLELFTPSCLLSNEMRYSGISSDQQKHQTNFVLASAERLDYLLGTLVPMRFLIPAACTTIKNICGTITNTDVAVLWEEAGIMFSILKVSIDKSTREDLTPFIPQLFDVFLTALELHGITNHEERRTFASCINDTFMTLVMKLSETQLQNLYVRFREWRGELNVDNSTTSSCVKRFAFWNMSARLSKDLRGIFLSCLTTVFHDAVEELNHYASALTTTSRINDKDDLEEGRQRKKLKIDNQATVDHDMEAFTTLQPILLCLQHAFTADADTNGGNWIRADDGARYNTFLKCITKLFTCVIPKNFYIAIDNDNEVKKTTLYQRIIQGLNTIESGCVIGCLTSLAAAAGNEQMWKPLNRCIVDACGHARPEVRKVGLTALLSILNKIGEEYTPLLPECMSVLSELLEDEVEDISSMAREFQRVGEELLGESFEDSF